MREEQADRENWKGGHVSGVGAWLRHERRGRRAAGSSMSSGDTVYVCDALNNRVVRAVLTHEAETEVAIEAFPADRLEGSR